MEKFFSRFYNKNRIQKLIVDIKTGYMFNRLHEFERAMEKYLPNRMEPDITRVLEIGKPYIPVEFEGEAILTVGRSIVFIEDGAEMVVNCAPFGCMPGNITSSMFQNIQRDYNKPIINLFYDGESDINRIISIYLNNLYKDMPEIVQKVV